jgi:predicted negative regulator of RcsB-dependent stress response
MSKRLNFCVRVAIAVIIGILLLRVVGRVFQGGAGYDIGAAMEIVGLGLFYGVVLMLLFGIPFIQRVGEKVSQLYEPGDADFPIVPQYSVADARVKEGKYQEAVAEYRKVITEHPSDVYAHVRIAELAVEHLHDLKLAEAELLAAQAKAVREDAVTLAAHRLADLYQYKLNSPQRGLDVLRSVQGRLNSAKHVKLMEERIEFLRQLVEGGCQVPQPPKGIQLRKSRYRMHDDPPQRS